ncbi:MAG: HAD family hydrolase [Verrucomicrobiales bacterium]
MRFGALFDWDGVIIDSHVHHEAAWEAMASEMNQTLPPDFFKTTFGMRNDRIISEFTNWAAAEEKARIAELANRKEALYREFICRQGIEPLPGVLSLLEALNHAQIPCAVASSTPIDNIRAIMEITGLGSQFAAVCAEKDVSRGKPDPEIFIVAAGKIARAPSHCVVFEDAHVGVEAGRAAGCKVIAVATTHPAESFVGKADLIVQTLNELTLEKVLELLRQE